jgi:cytochrome c oxidase assembly protein subunit 11
VTVRFDANVANGIGWAFRPEQREIRVRLGEVAKVSFFAENRTDRTSTGSAVFNVAPESAGAFFNKIACFCFTSQTLKAGEKVEMPVTFFVDPKMADDADNRYTDTITLSYTFYPSPEADSAPVASIAPKASGKPL